MLIDFHHHHWQSTEATLNIRSFHQGETTLFAQWPSLCSVGLHPWFIADVEEARNEQWDWFAQAARLDKVVMIGECGLDKLQGPDPKDQLLVLEQCLHLAGELKKPVVIHCVRAFEELFALVKRVRPSVPLIVHGFARKPSVLQSVLTQGFYLSFGAAILAPNGAAAQSLAQTPLEKLFLESDDKMLPIADLYTRAAQLKGIDLDALEAAIEQNWEKIRS